MNGGLRHDAQRSKTNMNEVTQLGGIAFFFLEVFGTEKAEALMYLRHLLVSFFIIIIDCSVVVQYAAFFSTSLCTTLALAPLLVVVTPLNLSVVPDIFFLFFRSLKSQTHRQNYLCLLSSLSQVNKKGRLNLYVHMSLSSLCFISNPSPCFLGCLSMRAFPIKKGE